MAGPLAPRGARYWHQAPDHAPGVAGVGRAPQCDSWGDTQIHCTYRLPTCRIRFLEQSGRAVSTLYEPTRVLLEAGDKISPGRIAIVGMSGRYPDSDSLEEFWNIIAEGKIAHRESSPSYIINSACASGLSTVTLACLSLLLQECNIAVARGTNIIASPPTYHSLSKAGFLSTTRGCKTYQTDADSYCRGEFVKAFFLKRLEHAVADYDNVLSVISSPTQAALLIGLHPAS
ncbi:Putative beta-ketoacyl synthase, thiolase, thiolase, acyl-enzyme intermediate active [Colletotrichum destructivum]|uniref:Beta-ketoacyl synthase, thiolase, thiolase, acyl-enzyme intermediate active n=1 Tax=Colletotrichum destructivum TaxID=34406 RepID=A0AAX4I7R9_9PEZI|nr:Putative beta-ketoacyl synthase, thiolase, thiolase, acyl-enzyme intermediate active [Colletotrichum destructivum]